MLLDQVKNVVVVWAVKGREKRKFKRDKMIKEREREKEKERERDVGVKMI